MATATNLGTIYTAGLNNVGTYQVSGVPFATGSVDCSNTTKIEFPYVTRWIMISNNGTTPVSVGFSRAGVEVNAQLSAGDIGENYFVLGKPSATDVAVTTPRMELKLTELWVSGSSNVSVMAGLTNLPIARVDNISTSGTNWSGSVGVG